MLLLKRSTLNNEEESSLYRPEGAHVGAHMWNGQNKKAHGLKLEHKGERKHMMEKKKG
jgi:hypothetical protein